MRFVCGRHWQPWRSLRESCIVALIPLHGGSLAVAAFFFGPSRFTDRILDVFLACRRGSLHANFFPVVQNRRSAEREIQAGHQFRDLVIVLPITVAIVGANNVVIADDERGPAGSGVDGGNLLAELRW